MDKKIIAERLREEAVNKFGSLEKFSKHIGSNLSNLSQYFYGRNLPGVALLLKFAEAGLDIEFILTGKSDKEKRSLSKIMDQVNNREFVLKHTYRTNESKKSYQPTDLHRELEEVRKENEQLRASIMKIISSIQSIEKIVKKKKK